MALGGPFPLTDPNSGIDGRLMMGGVREAMESAAERSLRSGCGRAFLGRDGEGRSTKGRAVKTRSAVREMGMVQMTGKGTCTVRDEYGYDIGTFYEAVHYAI
jgi:hypothetical protein